MRKKLGEILIDSGAVTLADIEGALDDQSAGEPSRLGEVLLARGKITAAQLGRALAEQYGLPYAEIPPLPQAVLELVPFDLQQRFRFLPLRSEGTELTIAMADLANLEVVATLEQTWTRVHVCVAAVDQVDATLLSAAGFFGGAPELVLPSVAPAIAPTVAVGPSADELFGGLEGPSSPVPGVAPVAPQAPRPSPVAGPPRAEDLFGDLNLESARTGIAARSPEATALTLDALAGAPVAPAPAEAEVEEAPPVVAGEMLPESEEPAPAPAPAAPMVEPEVVLEAEPLREGTGPILGLHEGTGPVIEAGFFTELPMSDEPAIIPPKAPPAPAAPVVAPAPSSGPEAVAPAPLPDWLAGDAAPVPPAPQGHVAAARAAGASPGWTGALDHLAPSKLAQGVARALLAKGLLTEQEILDALERKK